jgi:hypothetical protein
MENCKSQNKKPLYSTNFELMCGVIKYNNKTYLLDYDDKDRIINSNKSFVFQNETDTYPSYCYNYKRFTYIDFIFNFNTETTTYVFKNNNIYDLRRINVNFYHVYHKIIIQNYHVVEYVHGHSLTMGQDANKMKNPIWKIKDNEKDIFLMHCEKNTLCKLCSESYQKILNYEETYNCGKKITWFKLHNGYIMGSNDLYIHQVITGCYGNGKGTKNISVDHIDQDPLNNTFANLRIATRKEQEENSKGIKQGTKRERKTNAKSLPDGITQNMLKKYVVYYQEWLDKEHTKQREFFKIEKHPKLDKPWMTTKSNKISINEKLQIANKVVDDLENDMYPPNQQSILPKYVSLIIFREKPHLVYEKRVDDKRLNLKMVLPDDYDLDEQLNILNDKLNIKYENISLFECDKQEDDNVILNKFKYTLSIDCNLDDTYKHIKYVIFDISRYGKHKHTIVLDAAVTQKQAVTKAEEFLSEKITQEYYDKVKDDLFCSFKTGDYEIDYIYSQNRGFLLTDCKFLEIASTDCDILTITCAS